MGTVASELKSEREKRKISLAQIAAETRISLRHLESLEEGRFRDLPGGMYNRAFLKAYCETLNLNPQEIIERFESELAPVSEKPKPLKSRTQIPQPNRSFRISPVFVWGLMLLISASGIFFSRKWITAIFSPYFSHTPAATIPYEPAPSEPPPKPATAEPAAATAEPGTSPAQDDSAVAPAAAPTTPSGSTEAPVPSAPPQQPEVAPGPPPSPSTATPAATAQQALRLDISATQECWISVDRDGSPAIRKVMAPGELQSFSAAEKFQIVLGNAGGVQLKINGKPSRPLGKPGEVVKILIDTKNLQDFINQAAG